MRLINTTTLTLQSFMLPAPQLPSYAILSHTWYPSPDDEVTFQDFTLLPRHELEKKRGYAKISQTCQRAKKSGIKWAWVDTCCIDKTSSAELTEAINSMFAWYKGATVCFAFLEDLEPVPGTARGSGTGRRLGLGVPQGQNGQNGQNGPGQSEGRLSVSDDGGSNVGSNVSAATGSRMGSTTSSTHIQAGRMEHLSHEEKVRRFGACRWFTRGWTLQELIAPSKMGFYNSKWEFVGEKPALKQVLAEITQISESVLENSALLPTIPVAQRMSWASSRVTTRPEDMAYCLLGIFDVQSPLMYGEGEKAFIRLQEEIVKETNDFSIFAWKTGKGSGTQHQKHWGILAPSPKEFAGSRDIEVWGNPLYNAECYVTGKGLRFTPAPGGGGLLRSGSSRFKGTEGTYLLDLGCYHRSEKGKAIGVFLQQHGSDLYCRVVPESLPSWSTGLGVPQPPLTKNRTFYVTKTVSQVASTMLGSSHRWAFNLSQVFTAMAGIKYLPQQSQFQPEESWDPERRLFLSQQSRNFSCCAVFVTTRRDGLGALRILVWCQLHLVDGVEEEAQASVKVEFDPPTEGKTDSDGFVKCKGKVVRESYEGQPVFRVEVEATTSKFRALPTMMSFRGTNASMNKMARAQQMKHYEKVAAAAEGRERYFNAEAASMSSTMVGSLETPGDDLEASQEALEEQERIRKELDKQKSANKARIAREKKKAKELADIQARKKKGLPLVDVHPSQDTISRFIRKGDGNTAPKRDSSGNVKGKSSEEPIRTVYPERDSSNKNIPGERDEVVGSPRKRPRLGEDSPPKRQDAVTIPDKGNTELVEDKSKKQRPRNTPEHASDNGQPRPGDENNMAATSHNTPQGEDKRGEVPPNKANSQSKSQERTTTITDKENMPRVEGKTESTSQRSSQLRRAGKEGSQSNGRTSSRAISSMNRIQTPEEVVMVPLPNLTRLQPDRHLEDMGLSRSRANKEVLRPKEQEVPPPKPAPARKVIKPLPTGMRPRSPLGETDGNRSTPPKPTKETVSAQGYLEPELANKEKQPQVPKENFQLKPRESTPKPSVFAPQYRPIGPPAFVPQHPSPGPPRFKKPLARPSSGAIQKPKFLQRNNLQTAASRASLSSNIGKPAVTSSDTPPSSTQLFVMSHLDDLLPSPSQELRELEGDAQPTPISRPPAFKTFSNKQPQIPARFSKSPVASGPRRFVRQTSHVQIAPPRPRMQEVKPVEDDFFSFLSTQDLLFSSQDIRELESDTPCKVNNRTERFEPPSKQPPKKASSSPSLIINKGHRLSGTASATPAPNAVSGPASGKLAERVPTPSKQSSMDSVASNHQATSTASKARPASIPSSTTRGPKTISDSTSENQAERISNASIPSPWLRASATSTPKLSPVIGGQEQAKISNPSLPIASGATPPAPKPVPPARSPSPQRFFGSSGVGIQILLAMAESEKTFKEDEERRQEKARRERLIKERCKRVAEQKAKKAAEEKRKKAYEERAKVMERLRRQGEEIAQLKIPSARRADSPAAGAVPAQRPLTQAKQMPGQSIKHLIPSISKVKRPPGEWMPAQRRSIAKPVVQANHPQQLPPPNSYVQDRAQHPPQQAPQVTKTSTAPKPKSSIAGQNQIQQAMEVVPTSSQETDYEDGDLDGLGELGMGLTQFLGPDKDLSWLDDDDDDF
ncbi:heterokaryon incompatibility protein-domain-containing protein [Sordaria sp. MPI-SDFR-AT-0083]|nr:heterokaryon incompatibility protein-domain-containing protein [Sordaria sp. MPI-SDFR-AT-0083]